MKDADRSIELIGAKTGNCLRVAIGFEETGLPYQTRSVDLRHGEHREADHLALNPAGKVPTIIDRSRSDAFVLSQSNAILMHLDGLRPGVLLPLGLTERSVAMERFFYFITDAIGPSHAAFFLRNSGNKVGSAALDARSVAAIQDASRFIENSAFMAGDAFSLADIAAFTIAAACKRHIDWAKAPRLEQWYRGMEERSSVQRGMAAFDTENN